MNLKLNSEPFVEAKSNTIPINRASIVLKLSVHNLIWININAIINSKCSGKKLYKN